MGPKGMLCLAAATASAGHWDISACEQQGSCPYFPTFGTSLSSVSFFGWDNLQSEMTAAFQFHKGPISSDAKFDICQNDTLARKGHTQGGLLLLAAFDSSAPLRLNLFGCWQRMSLDGCWCGMLTVDDVFVGSPSPAWTLCQIIIMAMCVEGRGSPGEPC